MIPTVHRITILSSGWEFDASSDNTLLQAALAAGGRLPSSCRNGTCRACMCRLQEGPVRYRVEWPGLSREEKQEGWVLPCVAEPLGNVVLEAPWATPPA